MNEIGSPGGLLLKSSRGNKYFHDIKKKKTGVCHPVFFHLLQLDQLGNNLEHFLSEIGKEGLQIDNHVFSRDEAAYYYSKYLYYKKNGYFGSIRRETKFSTEMTAEDVRRSFINSRQLTLEITERCNLECEYCGYGKFYDDYDNREDKVMAPGMAIRMLEELFELWNSPANLSHDQNIYIGFYGGEPLLNMPLIKQVVSYVNNREAIHNHFTFAITTNAVLLDKYMDFLVENRFNLLISLDGNESNNSYRILKNGKPAFNRITRNISLLKKRYPDFFREKVNFNAVLHNKNSVTEIFDYFKREYDKIPSIGMLNTSGISAEHLESFLNTYVNVEESLEQSGNRTKIAKEMFTQLPMMQSLFLFLHKCNDFVFDNYLDLLAHGEERSKYITGTCIPFSKKIYVTVNGKILPCERIGHQFALGSISVKNGLHLDFQKVAGEYSALFKKLERQCRSCARIDLCTSCVFNMTFNDNRPLCENCTNQDHFANDIARYLDTLEENSNLYSRIMKHVIQK